MFSRAGRCNRNRYGLTYDQPCSCSSINLITPAVTRLALGIMHVIRNGLRWRDAPKDYGPHKTLYNRFVRWSRLGVFDRIFASLASERGAPEQLMIDATHLKAHRTAASLLKKGMFPAVSDARKAA